MTKAKVYFSDMRTRYGGLSLPQKLGKLIEAAGIGDIDFQNKFAAIKIHFGEPGNLSFLRPNYAKVVVDTVAAQGGRPFLTDCNTLYVGRRKHALEHITAAYENGFSPFSTGCHIIIADGLKGTDEAYVTVPGGELVQEAKIGKALMDADIVISLILKVTKLLVSAALLKISVWAAVLVPAKWKCTMTANRISVNANVSAAVPACGSVRMVRRSSKIKKRISIWINVLAADVVSVPVRRTR